MPSAIQSWLKDLCVLTLFLGVFYSMFLGFRPLIPPDEARYSEIPREMVVTGDYITPHLNGVKYFEKPALFYWLQSLSIKAFGLKEWALRLNTEILGIFGCIMTYIGGRKLYDRNVGFYSALILASSFIYIGLAHFITLDMALSTFLTGSLISFLFGISYPPGKKRRYFMWGMYVFAGFATMTKGLIGFVFPGMIIFTWLLMTGGWHQLRSYYLFSGSCIFLAITLPWHILVQLKNPEFFNFYFIEQHFLRYLTSYAERQQPVWFLPLVLILGFFPWTNFLFLALKDTVIKIKKPKQNLIEVFFLLWASLIFIFYWISHSQLVPYILPIFPPLAILTGKYLTQYAEKKNKAFTISFWLTTLFSVFICVGIILFGINHGYYKPQLFLFGLVPFFFLSGTLFYQRQRKSLAVFFLCLGAFFLPNIGNLCFDLFDSKSIKPLAIKLSKNLKTNDEVFTFRTYFQDVPVYINNCVKVVDWTGELTFGSQHQNVKKIFLNEPNLLTEWSDTGRKFMFVKSKDLDYLKNNLHLKYYLMEQKGQHALICNQQLKQ